MERVHEPTPEAKSRIRQRRSPHPLAGESPATALGPTRIHAGTGVLRKGNPSGHTRLSAENHTLLCCGLGPQGDGASKPRRNRYSPRHNCQHRQSTYPPSTITATTAPRDMLPAAGRKKAYEAHPDREISCP